MRYNPKVFFYQRNCPLLILDPDPYLLPCYRISPFQTRDIHENNQLPDSDTIDNYFGERFGGRQYHYVADGRKAINIALQQYNLQPDDTVTIFTTSGNFYISGCVTKEIEKFCRWSRKMEENTRLIFVNHEFGLPYKHIEELAKYKLPVIEDSCHSFFSTNNENTIGNSGDFVIYSFPKMFPIQVGGLLVTKKAIKENQADILTGEKLRYIKNVLSHYIGQKDMIISNRLNNYNYLKEKLGNLACEERFELSEGEIPGVFMFRVKNDNLPLPQLKEYLYAHGIQCSVFYGEQSFFIPVHQNLLKTDLDYFLEVIASFNKKILMNG